MAFKGKELLIEVDLPGNDAFGWDLTTISFSSLTKDISGQNGSPNSMAFNDDGSKFYLVGEDSFGLIYEYDLSTEYDISTATYNAVSFNPDDVTPRGIFFKPDGLKMYVGGSGNDEITQYTLSTAWDLSSASLDTNLLDISGEEVLIKGLTLSVDGTTLYIVGANQTVYQYALSTAWDLDSAAYASKSFLASSQLTNALDVGFSSDGLKMYVCGSSPSAVFEYDLSTAWDVSTASYNSVTFDFSFYQTSADGIVFDPTGTKLYISGTENDTIFQFDLDASTPAVAAGYTIVGLLISKTFTIGSGTIEVTNFDSNDWRELDNRGLGDRTLDASGSGILDTTDAALKYMEDAVWEGYPVDLYLTLPNGDYFSGTFKVPTFERTGDIGGAVTFSMSMEGSGEILLNRAAILTYLTILGESTSVGSGETGGDSVVVVSTDGGTTFAPQVALTGGSIQHEELASNGAGVIVVAGDSGDVRTSSDNGATWIPQTSGTANNLKDVTYGASLFVVAGRSDTLLTSADNGVTWVPRTSTIGNNLNAISHNGTDLFVLVGDGPSIAISADAVTWTSKTYAGIFNANDVAYGNGVWITVANGGEITRSVDAGLTWNLLTSGITAHLNTVVYDPTNDTWFAAGRSGEIWTSIDSGATWSISYNSADNQQFQDIEFDGVDTVYTVGVNFTGGTLPVALKSNNGGSSWTVIDMTTAGMQGLDAVLIS